MQVLLEANLLLEENLKPVGNLKPVELPSVTIRSE